MTYQADGKTWEVESVDDEGITLSWDKYLINVCPLDKAVFVYRKLKNGGTKGIWWNFSFEEIEMVYKVIQEELK